MKNTGSYLIFPLLYVGLILILTYSESSAQIKSQNIGIEDYIWKAAHVTPSPRQLAWQELEFNMFIHFFKPKEVHARQWARVCEEAGMKMILLTAKHHWGFCLWPSRYTDFSVKNSDYKNGKGDVVREVADACREFGIKFGIYLSPWDKHEPTYGTPAYNDFFKNQLRELLTNYGEIAEVWFDGYYGGPEGGKQDYDWEGYYQVVRELQPNAVIAITGPDVRWVGTEEGYGRETEWSVIPAPTLKYSEFIDEFSNITAKESDLGGREKLMNAKYLIWYPSEVDVSIRPSWGYRDYEDDQVKSLETLLNIYYSSVGRNSVLLLNFPPDTRGLINENDIKRVMELRKVLDATFDEDLAVGSKVTASQVRGNDPRFSADKTVDHNKETYWTTNEWTTVASLEFDLGDGKIFNRAMLQEYIKVGQRIESFMIEAWDGKAWQEFARGTTVGYKRLLRFDNVSTSKVRLRILESRVCPTLSNFGLFYQPPIGKILN